MTNVLLIVLDGFGIAQPGPGNAIDQANPETINGLFRMYPNTRLTASGEAVGLPPGEVGSTEVGHLNIGAGRIIYQSLPRINLSIADGSFYKNEALLGAVSQVKKNSSDLHIIGLVGAGTVHASMDHLYALLFLCKEQGVERVYLHMITDGRDSPPRAALNYIENVKQKIETMPHVQIASVMGRYYAMDRDKRWERIKTAYECLTIGNGRQAKNCSDAINASYTNNLSDEFIEPTNIVDDLNKPVGLVKQGDAVIFYNFRIDRPRELTKAFVLDDFEHNANATSYDPYVTKYFKKHLKDEEVFSPPFTRGKKIDDVYFVTMTEYERELPVHVAFPPHVIQMPLGRLISEKQMPQLRMSESEKERFVTFYFNGLRETAFPLEERIIIPSPRVATYNLKPEMSAPEITDVLIKKMFEQKYRFILVNFANPDMVGHTGDLQAGISAIKALDTCLAKIVATADKTNYTLLVTADHGNIEQMINPDTNMASTEHTNNPVPFIAVNKQFLGKTLKLQSGILADIAPTVLYLLGLPKPHDMTGRNLLEDYHV